MANAIFSLQPTFTQGLILGQFSILGLLYLILKYLFFETSPSRGQTFSYQPCTESDTSSARKTEQVFKTYDRPNEETESTEWLNALVQKVANIYRSKLQNGVEGPEGLEIARKRVEDYANRIRPSGFLDHIIVHSIDMGVSAPRLSNARLKDSTTSNLQTEFEVHYTDTISISLSTSYLFNYPLQSFARLPVSLTISLSKFQSLMSITPPLPSSPSPVLTVNIPPTFTLDLTTTSLMGSRAKLANVPKLHELIQHQVRRIFAQRATWNITLPGLTTIVRVEDEMKRDPKTEKSTRL